MIGMTSRRSSAYRNRKIAAFFMVALWGCEIAATGTGWAGPTGGQVQNGSATINYSGSTTNINQGSDSAVINWQSFSIGGGETVNFDQPNAAAVTLNRVTGNETSVIEGALNANGNIFLVNSNGILFSEGARVNSAGLIASTLDITDEDFAAGNYVFDAGRSTGSVINMGTITAADGGYVGLLGNSVANEGVITATRGTVALTAGDAVTLNFNGDSLLSVTVDEGALDALVENNRAIYADGGTVIMTATAAEDLLSAQVNNTGIIQARTIDDLTGDITLYAYGGSTTVDGVLDASATDGGDGGFIETSGDQVTVADSVAITTAATDGSTGTWLIDPDGFTIGTDSVGSDITGGSLSTALENTSVTISSTNGTGDDGNINVNDEVTWSANTLTLNATNNIYVNAEVTATGSASLVANYGYKLDDSGNPTTAASGTGNDDGTPYGVYTLQSAEAGEYTGKINFDGTGAVVLNGETYTVINTADELEALYGSDISGDYVIGSDITASTTNMGSGIGSFSGNLNGFGHVISGVKLSETGLIDTITEGATASNLGLYNLYAYTDGDITTGSDALGTLANKNAGSLLNSFSYSGQLKHDNAAYVGGLVGINSGLIAQSYAACWVRVLDIGGGLVGYNTENGEIIDSSVESRGGIFAMDKTAATITYVGGFVGVNDGAISECYNHNFLSMMDSYSTAGGFAGRNSGAIDESYAVNTNQTNGPNVAGFVYDNTGTITNSYSNFLAFETDSQWSAGFVYRNSGTISDVYSVICSCGTRDDTRYAFAYENTGDIANAYWYGTTTSGATEITDQGHATQLTSQDEISALISNETFDSDIWGLSTSGYLLLRGLTVYITASEDLTYGDAADDISTLGLTTRGLQGWGHNRNNVDSVDSSDAGPFAVLDTAVENGYVDAGTYTLSELVTGSDTYTDIRGLEGLVAITPKTLALGDGAVADKTYDGATAATLGDAIQVSGLVGDQTLNITYTAAEFGDKNAGDDKTVHLTYTASDGENGGKLSNYVIADTTTATIDQREVSTSYTVDDKTYDGATDATVTYSLDNALDGDDLGLSYSALFEDANAGEDKTVTVSALGLNGDDSGNYILTNSESTESAADIDQLVIELLGIADTNTSTTVSADNLTVANAVDGDAVSLSGSVTIAGAGAGSQTITDLSNLSVDNANYTLTGGGGTVAVSDANLILDEVVYGSANVESSGGTTTVTQTTDAAAINWMRFSIASDETVTFAQPNATSVALNRVVGNEQSIIEGALNANGRVFIINSNGILFTAGSSVNVAGLVAGTLEINEDDFENGNYVFTASGDSGSTIARGDIVIVDGGLLALAGHGATHTGTLTAKGGDALLVSADRLTLSFNSDGSLSDYTVGNLDGAATVAGAITLTGEDGAGGLLETAGGTVSIDDALSLSSGAWSLSLPAITIGEVGTFSTDFVAGNLALRSLALNAIGGDLELNGAIDVSKDTTLTLSSTHDVNINADITVSGRSAALALIYGNDYNIDSDSGAGIAFTGENAALTINDNAYTLITGMADLEALDTADGYYALAGDIDASGTTYTSALIGTLSGTLTGLGNTIRNLTIVGGAGAAYLALINTAETGSVIRDLSLENTYVSGYQYIAPLVSQSYAAIKNVSASGTVEGIAVAGQTAASNIGGLVAWQRYGSVTDAHADVDVSAYSNGIYTSSSIGGLIGYAYGTSVSDSSASGDVLGNTNVGGLIGRIGGKSSARSTISNCYATGNVTGEDPDDGTGDINGDGIDDDATQSQKIGGLIGTASKTDISDSYAAGDVIGGAWVGGLVGRSSNVTVSDCYATGDVTNNSPENQDSILGSIGGLIGSSYNSSVEDSYATGDVVGNIDTGGLIGTADKTTISGSHATGDVSGDAMWTENAGGLVGSVTDSDISDSYATGDVSGYFSVGGLVGDASSTDISGSHAEGNVSATQTAGGLVGTYSGGAISDSYATGDVSVSSRYAGGLVAFASNATLTNVWASGDVTAVASLHTGGSGDLVEADNVGGLAGSINNTAIENGSATGNITVEGNTSGTVGGLVGSARNGSSVSDSTATGSVTVDGESAGALVGNDLDGSTGVSNSTYTDVAAEAAAEAAAAEAAAAEAAAAEVAAAEVAAARQAALESAAAGQAGQATGQALQSEADFATSGGEVNVTGLQESALDPQILYADSESYGARITSVSADGVQYDLESGSDDEEESENEASRKKNE